MMLNSAGCKIKEPAPDLWLLINYWAAQEHRGWVRAHPRYQKAGFHDNGELSVLKGKKCIRKFLSITR